MSSESAGPTEEKASADTKSTTELTLTADEVRPFATYLLAAVAAKMLQNEGASSSLVKELLRHGTIANAKADGEIPGAKKTTEQLKADLVKDLLRSGVDPALFDSLLSNEINRRLKVRFGVFFLVITFVFTAASYSIVILNSVCGWKISDVAITSLIIQAPIQLIGLLYIVARNLFPSTETPFGRERPSTRPSK